MPRKPTKRKAAHPRDVTAEWIRGPADERAVAAGHYFDLAAAERVRDFFHRFLRHTTGQWAGKPFELLGWEWRDVIGPLFGWKKPNGLRRFTRGYLSCGKKNGKTGLLSGLSLFLILADGEAAAEVYSAASDRAQAALIFTEAAKMIDASPPLQRVCSYLESTKTILNKCDRSFYRAMSAEAGTKDGPNAHAILFDELHAQPNRELWDKLRYAGSARTQPLMLAITTAGSDKETICGEQYEYAKRVIAGDVTDHSFFAQIYEAGEQDDWTSEETWHKANPSLGVTIDIDKFRADFIEARETPAKENSFRRYRLNQWVQTADAWLSMDQWDACKGTLDALLLRKAMEGMECYGGLDLSATDDTTALLLLFHDASTGAIDLVPFLWLPQENILKLERKHRVPYTAWAREGYIELTPGNVVDYNLIRARLRELAAKYQIKQLAIDRKFQGQSLENDLIADGFNVVPHGQGWVSQDLPAKELERLLKAGLLRHGGHPVYRWHASNVVVDIDKNGNYSINKRLSRSKIDAIAATLMALLCKMQDAGGDEELYVNKNPKLIVV